MRYCKIELPYVCFSIDIEDGIVIDSAPIGKWMIGKNINEIIRWVEKKKGKIYCPDELSMCPHCYCMTYTSLEGICEKCKRKKT